MFERVRNFADSTNFTNALKVTLASAIPVVVFALMNDFATGFAIALGVLLTYPGDIPSNRKHKIIGILVSAVIVASANLIINFVYPYTFVFYPVYAILVFALALISVYGHRATMVSFSGLLSASLALADIQQGTDMLIHAGLMLIGGIFYLLVSLLFEILRPHRYVQLQMAECIRLTAKYMKLRGDLWNVGADRSKIVEKQLALQVELNNIHENLREILIRNRSRQGSSNENRKMLLLFIYSVEVLELALSTSFDHNRLHTAFKGDASILNSYQQLAYKLANALKTVSKSLYNNKAYTKKSKLRDDLAQFEKQIEALEAREATHSSDSVLMLSNMLHYAEKQYDKITAIERGLTEKADLNALGNRDKELDKYLAPNYYPISTLVQNLSFTSVIFRHSLRLTVTLIAAMLIGVYFKLDNSYWILLTIIVIMRPGYGLTKKRSADRIVGTVIGGIIAFVLLIIVKSMVVLSILLVLFMLLGYAFTSINYKIAAACVTVYVVFLYAALIPGSELIIGLRIVDTIVGAMLAFAANYFLWPGWESQTVRSYIKNAIEANKKYLREITTYYNNKGDVTTDYRLARKNAFIETGNLMASFQRMAQEPKSQQEGMASVYKLVELNHSLQSAIASLGTYIQTHQTTKASDAFNVVANSVQRNLDRATSALEANEEPPAPEIENLESRFSELRKIRERELQDEQAFREKMLEAQLVIEQLVWMVSLSEGILKSVRKLRSEVS